MINLIVQSFGKETEYRRAVLTILSFYAHVGEARKALLFTDNPEWFNVYFKDLEVKYIQLTAHKIKSMRGEIDFLHRMKIAMIEEAFALTDGNMIYADSDSFFTRDIKHLTDLLSPEQSFMHLREYPFDDLRNMALPAGKTFRAFLELIENNRFKLANGSDLIITPQHASWNAGVMLFHSSHVRFIPDVYALTDQFFPFTQNHASEQYAFSVVLQDHTSLKSCDEINYHYWYKVKKQVIDQFLEKNVTSSWALQPLQTKIAIVKQWTNELPGLLDEHEWVLKDNAIQAFNNDMFFEGYKWVFKAILNDPLSPTLFYKDILYHTKRLIFKN